MKIYIIKIMKILMTQFDWSLYRCWTKWKDSSIKNRNEPTITPTIRPTNIPRATCDKIELDANSNSFFDLSLRDDSSIKPSSI